MKSVSCSFVFPTSESEVPAWTAEVLGIPLEKLAGLPEDEIVAAVKLAARIAAAAVAKRMFEEGGR